MMTNPQKKGKDANKPFDARPAKNRKKAFDDTEKSVDAVAKDTNRTRRKNTLLPLKNAMKKKSAKEQGKREGKKA